MGISGPIRQPDSRRGENEGLGSVEVIQEELQAPSWLSKKERDHFEATVAAQRAAGVGMRAIDAERYAQYSRLCLKFVASKDTRETLAIQRTMNQLAIALTIGEYARQRIGIRGRKPKQKTKLEIMMSKRHGAVEPAG